MLRTATLTALLCATTSVLAAPAPLITPNLAGRGLEEVPRDPIIHESCNDTQRAFLEDGIEQLKAITWNARNHILTHGENDTLYQTYFGNAPSSHAVGVYTSILESNKTGVYLRCDNPDGNCELLSDGEPWAGHWRGDNASLETVICEPTYHVRIPLQDLCKDDHTILEEDSASKFLAGDLMHRLLHVPTISWNHIEHFADGYAEVLELALNETSTGAGANQHTLQYFALDAYALDVANPGKGCLGEVPEVEAPEEPAPETDDADESSEPAAEESDESSGGSDCHTHADGSIHCV